MRSRRKVLRAARTRPTRGAPRAYPSPRSSVRRRVRPCTRRHGVPPGPLEPKYKRAYAREGTRATLRRRVANSFHVPHRDAGLQRGTRSRHGASRPACAHRAPMVGASGERAEASRILRGDLDRPFVGPLRRWVDAAIEVVAVGPYDAYGVLGERVGERLRGTPADTSPSGSPSASRRRRGRSTSRRSLRRAAPRWTPRSSATSPQRLSRCSPSRGGFRPSRNGAEGPFVASSR